MQLFATPLSSRLLLTRSLVVPALLLALIASGALAYVSSGPIAELLRAAGPR